MKIKASLTAMKAGRNPFGLPAHIWLIFGDSSEIKVTDKIFSNFP